MSLGRLRLPMAVRRGCPRTHEGLISFRYRIGPDEMTSAFVLNQSWDDLASETRPNGSVPSHGRLGPVRP